MPRQRKPALLTSNLTTILGGAPVVPLLDGNALRVTVGTMAFNPNMANEVDQRWTRHLTVLKSAGVDDIMKVKDVKLDQNTEVTPGVLFKELDRKQVYGNGSRTLSNVLALDSRRSVKPTRYAAARTNSKAFSKDLNVVRIEEAYWAADTLEIGDNVKIIFSYPNRYLTIIARKIVFGRNVEITWAMPVLGEPPQPSPPKQAGQRGNGDGRDGSDGRTGVIGRTGNAAPHLEVWTTGIEFADDKYRPVFYLQGQDGGKGGRGQDGGKGGNGSNGQHGVMRPVWNPLAKDTSQSDKGCSRFCTDGRRGGNGGRAGSGGAGGRGGDGGRFDLYATEKAIASFGEDFGIFVEAGRGGPGGDPGNPGGKGSGGRRGSTPSKGTWRCGRASWGGDCHAGKDGNAGATNAVGTAGRDGDELVNPQSFIPIDGAAFTAKWNAPAIMTLDPQIVDIGDTIDVKGENFKNGDSIEIGGKSVPAQFLTNNHLKFVVPSGISGGSIAVCARRSASVKSNFIEMIVTPRIDSLDQVGAKGNPKRLVPGKTVTIDGDGFTEDMRVYIEGEQMDTAFYRSPTKAEFTLERPSNVQPNPAGEIVTVHVELGTGAAQSNKVKAVIDTFVLLVIGDSIQWGQGLLEHEKMHSQVEQYVAEKLGDVSIYKTVKAHSGAIIKPYPDKTDPRKKFHGEVPNSYPTINEQIDDFLGRRNEDDTVDLILMDGGINDVDVVEILFGATSEAEFKQRIDDRCYQPVVDLVQRTRNHFPNAEIIYTGYFKIVSQDSDLSELPLIGAALGATLGGAVGGGGGAVVGAGGGAVLGAAARDNAVKRAAIFYDYTHATLRKAINDSGVAGVTFVDPGFTDKNALFTGRSSRLFGVDLAMTPQDPGEVQDIRIRECPKKDDDSLCLTASLGHPTPEGEEMYVREIKKVLGKVL